MMHGAPTPNGNARFLAFMALIEGRTPYQSAMIIAALQTTKGPVQ